MESKATMRALFPAMANEGVFAEAYRRMARTCPRQPAPFYKIAEGQTPWRTLRKHIHAAITASGGRALPDVKALLAEFEQDAERAAGVASARPLPLAICDGNVADAHSDAIETVVALNPTRSNVEELLARKLAERDAIEVTIDALYQVRDGFDARQRSAA